MIERARILPGTGRGTARRGVEGHAATYLDVSGGREMTHLPLHHAAHGPPPRFGEVL